MVKARVIHQHPLHQVPCRPSQVAVIAKFGLPTGGWARVEDFPSLDVSRPDGFIVHLAGGNISAAALLGLACIASGTRPSLFAGRADMLHPQVQNALGIAVTTASPLPLGTYAARLTPAGAALAPDAPLAFNVTVPLVARVAAAANVAAGAVFTPLVVVSDPTTGTDVPILVRCGSGSSLWWHP